VEENTIGWVRKHWVSFDVLEFLFYASGQSFKEREVVGHIRTTKLRFNSPFTCLTFGIAKTSSPGYSD